MFSKLTYSNIDGTSILIMCISFLTFSVVTGIAAMEILVRLPDTYFIDQRSTFDSLPTNPLVRLLLHILKNLLGAIVLVLGILMLVAPGPGLVTIVIGFLLMDIPGKRQLIGSIIRKRQVCGVINKLRISRSRKPLQLPKNDKNICKLGNELQKSSK